MSKSVDYLNDVVRKLRDPKTGCPWDIEQDFKSLAPCTIEEAYEVVEAIENGDMTHLCDELGDLLIQIVFFAQLAEDQGLFTLEDVAKGNADKMIERHPHVFGDRSGVDTADAVLANWEADKAKKRALNASQNATEPHSALGGVNVALPALARSMKLQKRAARVGFDWDKPQQVLAKIREEADELEVEITKGTDKSAMTDELGDLYFALTNLARHLDIDPETALRTTNRRFESRFRHVEKSFLSEGREISDGALDKMEEKWAEAKVAERS